MTDSCNCLGGGYPADEVAGDWTVPIASAIRIYGAGGYLVRFDVYRPDLVQGLAQCLGMAFVDFRAAIMALQGVKANRLSLDSIIETALAGDWGGVVLHNVEALLSVKTAAERQAWLNAFIARAWAKTIVVPLALYGEAAPVSVRTIRLDPSRLPGETLLGRLWATK